MKLVMTILCLLILNRTYGQTWNLLNSGTNKQLTDIQFTSENIGYISGDSGTVIKTQNGGNSFIDISINSTDYIYGISFVNDSVGYLITSHKLFKTNNGGINWTTQYFDTLNNFASIKFISEQVGFIGASNSILKTTDGGLNWINKTNSTYEINTISFPSSNVGYFTGGQGNGGRVFKTSDQGNTISAVNVNSANTIREQIQFINDSVGYLIGWYVPIIMKTVNGGINWVMNGSNWIGGNSIHFLDETNGYCIETGGGIVKINNSIDGGLNWNTELSFNPINNSNLYSLKKITSTNSSIYCIGENGKVYKKNVPLAIENINTKNTITIYPNPTNNYIVVNLPTIAKYKIINLNGQIIQSGAVKNQKIITQNLKPNKYILQIIFDNKVETFKIIKQE